VTSLSALLKSLDEGVRTAADEAPTSEPSTPGSWLDEARALPWARIAERAAKDSPAPRCETMRGAPRPELLVARKRRTALAVCSDAAALGAAAQSGTLLEQRAALARLAVLARETSTSDVSIDPGLAASEPELERDLLLWTAETTGAAAREARAILGAVTSLLATSEAKLRAAVDGVSNEDPLAHQAPHERATLMLHLRGASDFVVGYLNDELLESLEQGSVRKTARLLVGLRAAADPRLLPALGSALLDCSDVTVRTEAARALARIDDPRSAPLLQLAYQTASAREERVALVEAFGIQGEVRDSAFLREALDFYATHFRPGDPAASEEHSPREVIDPLSPSSREPTVRLVAALDAIFDPVLVEAAVRFATHEHAEVQRAAIRAIGRVGDDTALAWLDRIDEHIPDGLELELDTARAALLRRVELRGEKPEVLLDARRRRKRERALTRKFSRGLDVAPTKRHRALAWVLLGRAVLARLFRGRESASELSHLAHQADPGWYFPPLFQGRVWHAANDLARAITGYRRALAAAPRRLFRRTRWITPIVSAFVAHAEHLLRQGHTVRAQRLLDELWPYDLSRAASPVRLALRRCRQHLALPSEHTPLLEEKTGAEGAHS
jgi:hypothetical protein